MDEQEDRTMLVRLQGGDIIRRPVAYVDIKLFPDGSTQELQSYPELEDGEILYWPLGDPLPNIVQADA